MRAVTTVKDEGSSMKPPNAGHPDRRTALKCKASNSQDVLRETLSFADSLPR